MFENCSFRVRTSCKPIMLLESDKDSVRISEGVVRYTNHVFYILNGRKAIFVRNGHPIGFYDYTFIGDTLKLEYNGNSADRYRFNHSLFIKKLSQASYSVSMIKHPNLLFSEGRDAIYHVNTSISKIDDIINFDILEQPTVDYYANTKLVDCK